MKKLALSLIILAFIISGITLIVNYKTNEGLVNTQQTHQKNQKNVAKENPKDHMKSQEKKKKEAPHKRKKKRLVITIDPGHQLKANVGQEPEAPHSLQTKYKATVGSIGITTKRPEYAVTLEAAKKLSAQLKKKGFKTILTRHTNDVDLSNVERTKQANKNKSFLYIRIHADGAENPNASGFSVIAPAKNEHTTSFYKESKWAAEDILKQVSHRTDIYQNGISYRGDQAGFNWSKVPVVLVELGFLTNPNDEKRLLDRDKLDKLTVDIAKGVEIYSKRKK
ncbi:N-acetylmuramoyl-L-alanine amidase family protein [Rummeliibacillus stabekisii]|uniref:N-acetylmuramoyl-L-alanine amidase family protein n=1 Tax=Rummeliibacillus stabekisii TaxID=241244 RepID=UPI001167AB34|nr:N-acetylmuramoyl-L-alanine amidase [Rummeliibacillus stabekisii]MBB5169629.1 N-acetylmuramoyl-L-alanine amidase [Rummeliibacillus stabekisii]GEL03886.1 hypothetical protein RST01_05130 [Rummeliibacillus stabekisii]